MLRSSVCYYYHWLPASHLLLSLFFLRSLLLGSYLLLRSSVCYCYHCSEPTAAAVTTISSSLLFLVSLVKRGSQNMECTAQYPPWISISSLPFEPVRVFVLQSKEEQSPVEMTTHNCPSQTKLPSNLASQKARAQSQLLLQLKPLLYSAATVTTTTVVVLSLC